MFVSRFLGNSQSIWKRFTVLQKKIQVLRLLLCNPLDIFCSLAPKMGLKLAYRRLRKVSNAQLNTDISLEGLCILTGNDIISYFRLAANHVHATATVADFTTTKQSFWEISATAWDWSNCWKLKNFKIYHNIASIAFTFRPEMTSSSTSSRQQIA